MSMRKLDNKERKHVRSMAGAMLARGEHKDDVIYQAKGWLISRGWAPLAAHFRAREVALAIAEPGTGEHPTKKNADGT
jgi:hypothetical protein